VAENAFGAHTATPSELQERMAADRRGVPYLLYRDGGGNQRILSLDESVDRLTVGRDLASDIALPWDVQVSRAHTQVERMGAEWAIIDDGLSRNGTFVNGERLRGRRRLCNADVVRCGDTVLVFRAPLTASDSTVVAGKTPPLISDAQRRVLIALCRPFRDGGAFASPASNQQIAEELCVSTEAVKTQIRALFQRLGVEDLPQNRKRVRLVELAFHHGLVAPHDLDERPGA
jgi:pSer/pThr/pTyr-binding forkhead associated (FHA) protein/DNA-binding CsgD family transcriptional regulator